MIEPMTTYWGHTTTFPSITDELASIDTKLSSVLPPWSLQYSPTKGYYAISNHNYKQGDVICIERPLVYILGHHPFTRDQSLEIDHRLSLLNDTERDAFYALANVYDDEGSISKGAGIFMTNSFDMTHSPLGDGCAMYGAIARLNHSCSPNCQQTHIPETMEEVLIASRNIKIGDEINDCYIDLRMNKVARLKILKELYGFDCTCSACIDDNTSKDDKYREKALTLDELIISVTEEDGDLYSAYNLSVELISLLQQEAGLWGIRYLPGAYLSAYQLAVALGNNGDASNHIGMAHTYSLLLQGKDSPDTVHYLQLKNSHCKGC